MVYCLEKNVLELGLVVYDGFWKSCCNVGNIDIFFRIFVLIILNC